MNFKIKGAQNACGIALNFFSDGRFRGFLRDAYRKNNRESNHQRDEGGVNNEFHESKTFVHKRSVR